MNKVDSFNNNYGCLNAVKEIGETVVWGVAIVVCIVAHPIIGALGALGCLAAAAYHSNCSNHHWKQTFQKDERGNRIPDTDLMPNPTKYKIVLSADLKAVETQKPKNDYTYEHAKFEPKDLVRLQQEVQRLYHLKACEESLKWARGLSKCIIPLAGPVWAFLSEMGRGGSIAIGHCCEDLDTDQKHWFHKTHEEKLEFHINKLKK